MGQTFGRYILEKSLAVGGMGEVFLARQTGPNGFDRSCVVKTMHARHASDPELVELFLEEARLTARLNHPHVTQVYDFGRQDGSFFIAMERVDGPSLHTVIKSFASRGRQLPLGPVLRIVSQAAQALDYVHRVKGEGGAPLDLVHRDISPGNLLLSRDGLVKLIDFGIAKARTTQLQTRMGQIRGKLAYMSPEQMLGVPLDGRTDIYSLGLVLFELLTGRRANPGRSEVEILASVKAGLPAVATLRDDCPKALSQLVERATKRDREQRVGRAAELGQALEQLLVAQRLTVGPTDLAEVVEELERLPAEVPAATSTRRAAGAATTIDAAAATEPKRGRRSPAVVLAAVALLLATVAAVGRPWWRGTQVDETPSPVAVQPAPVELPKPQRLAPAVVMTAPELEPEPAPERVAAKPVRQKGRPAKVAPVVLPGDDEPIADPGPELPAAVATAGSVAVSSEPPTELFVDGVHRGTTPLTLELQPGAHRLELKEERLGLSWSRTVDVSAGGRETLSWKPARGQLDVRPVPPHVELQISVDGVAVGPTPISAFSVWEGQRRVSAHNAETGWHAEKSVEVRPGARVQLKVNDGSGIEVSAAR
ncbi:MAG: serine/threonine protein kinase [Myxococcaceae bacterium]|nr:serine/threonine protein kinase [Myxococcaceae bacterium]